MTRTKSSGKKAEARRAPRAQDPRIVCAGCSSRPCECFSTIQLVDEVVPLVAELLDRGSHPDLIARFELWLTRARQEDAEKAAVRARAPQRLRDALLMLIAFDEHLGTPEDNGVPASTVRAAKRWVAAGGFGRAS